MPGTPRFSFVATSRNDDHGGDILRRTQSFIDRLAEQVTRHKVSCELVLVDWNPPAGRAALEDVLSWPTGSEWFTARMITVSAAMHGRLRYANRLSMFQMIAKNVGIRRAFGDYIIATNIDIIFSDELFLWLKSDKMRKGVLYRSDRWDIPNEVQLELDLDRLLERAGKEAIRRNSSDGTYIRRGDSFVNTYSNRFDSTFFQPLQSTLERFKQSVAQQGALDPAAMLASFDVILAADLPRLRRTFLIPTLPTNGCGDFTMLARDDWFALRGYPEWEMFSWNIDSVIIYQAYYNGLAIEELDPTCVHYHIEHDYGSGWTPEGADSLWAKLAARGLPYINYQQFMEIIFQMEDNRDKQLLTTYNGLDWGFGNHELECQNIVVQDSPSRPPKTTNKGPLHEATHNRIPAIPGLLLEDGAAGAAGVRAEYRRDENGGFEIFVESLPQSWSYALVYDLSSLPYDSGEYWITLEILIDSGNVAAALVNRDGSMLLMEAACEGARPEVQQVVTYARDIGEVSLLVLRNITPGDQPTRFRLKRIELQREDAGATDEPAMRTAAGQSDSAREVPELPLQPGAGATGEEFTVSLAAIRTGDPDAIVRVLHGEPEDQRTSQAFVITQPTQGNAAALLDLGNRLRVLKVSVHVHVIQGEAVIGLQAQCRGKLQVMHRQSAGRPYQRVDLEVDGTDEIDQLVIANASPTGRAMLFLRHIEYHTG